MYRKNFFSVVFVIVIAIGIVLFYIYAKMVSRPKELDTTTSTTTSGAVLQEPTREAQTLDERTLSFRGEGLTKLPQKLFDDPSVVTLDLSNNHLSSLPAEVRMLMSLRILDVSHNELTNIPAELGQLSKLEVLNLSYNHLTGLPYELGNLSHLKILDLRGNTFAGADLDIIKKKLPTNVSILTDSTSTSIGNDSQMEYPVSDTPMN